MIQHVNSEGATRRLDVNPARWWRHTGKCGHAKSKRRSAAPTFSTVRAAGDGAGGAAADEVLRAVEAREGAASQEFLFLKVRRVGRRH